MWSALQNWGSQLGSLLIFLVLARLLTPEDFGLVALANVFLAFVQIFTDQGFPQALIQRQELEPDHIDTAFWTTLGFSSLLLLAGLLLAPVAANAFDRPLLTPILRWFSLLLLVGSLADVQQALLERQFAFRFVALRALLGLAIGGIVGIALAVGGAGVWSLVAQQLTTEAIGVVVLWRSSSWRPRWRFSRRHFQQLFRFGSNIFAFNFLGFINGRADDLLIGYFLGPTALGYYSVAYRILTMMTQVLIDTSNRVALPTFSRLQLDLDRLRSAFYKVTRLTSLLAFPSFLGIAVLAPKIIPIFFGPQWLASVPVLQILALAGIFRSVSRFKSAVLLAVGQPFWRVWIGLLAASLNLIGFAIAVRWGIIAVAWAYLIRACIMFPLVQALLNRIMQASVWAYLRQFMQPFSATLVMVVVLLLAERGVNALNLSVQLAILVGVGSLTYLGAIRLLAPALFQEFWGLIQAMLPKLKSKQT